MKKLIRLAIVFVCIFGSLLAILLIQNNSTKQISTKAPWLFHPTSMSIDNHNTIYCANRTTNQVVAIDITTSEVKYSFQCPERYGGTFDVIGSTDNGVLIYPYRSKKIYEFRNGKEVNVQSVEPSFSPELSNKEIQSPNGMKYKIKKCLTYQWIVSCNSDGSPKVNYFYSPIYAIFIFVFYFLFILSGLAAFLCAGILLVKKILENSTKN